MPSSSSEKYGPYDSAVSNKVMPWSIRLQWRSLRLRRVDLAVIPREVAETPNLPSGLKGAPACMTIVTMRAERSLRRALTTDHAAEQR